MKWQTLLYQTITLITSKLVSNIVCNWSSTWSCKIIMELTLYYIVRLFEVLIAWLVYHYTSID